MGITCTRGSSISSWIHFGISDQRATRSSLHRHAGHALLNSTNSKHDNDDNEMKHQRGGTRLWLSLLLVVALALCHSSVHTAADVSVQTEGVVGCESRYALVSCMSITRVCVC